MRPPGLTASLWEALTRSTAPPIKATTKAIGRTARTAEHSHVSRSYTSHAARFGSSAPSPFVESLLGIFKSVKPGYAQSASPSSSSLVTSRTLSSSSRQSVRSRSGLGSFPQARPGAIRPSFSGHQLGLSSARNFSSGRTVFENVINNVPLALRALVNGKDGIDERRWTKARGELRAVMKTDVKGKGKMIDSALLQQQRKQQFEAFFGSSQSVWGDVESQQGSASLHADSVSAGPSVVLVVPLEPEMSLALLQGSTSRAPDIDGYRLITPTVLSVFSHLTTAYEDHGHRLRTLCNKLIRSGVDQDPNIEAEIIFLTNGQKEIRFVFGHPWTKQDVRAALGDWNPDREQWYQILEHDHYENDQPVVAFATCDSGVQYSSPPASTFAGSALDTASLYGEEEHDQVVTSFFLPTLSTTTDMPPYHSPEATQWGSYTSSIEAMDISYENVAVQSHSFSDEDTFSEMEGSVWDDDEVETLGYKEGVIAFLEETEMRQRQREMERVL